MSGRARELKKIFIALLLLFVTLASSCSRGVKLKPIEVALIGKDKDPFTEYLRAGAESAGKDLGVVVHFYSPIKEDPAWQIQKVEEALNQKIDGLAISASDPKVIRPLMLKSMEAGVPCVAMDNDIARGRHAYIGSGNYYTGEQAAKEMLKLVQKGRIAIVSDSIKPDLLQRIYGIKDTIADQEGIKLLSARDNEHGVFWSSKIEDLLTLEPHVDGIICVSDDASLNVLSKFQDKQTKLVCIGESPELIKHIESGDIDIVISRRPYAIGYLTVLVLQNMIRAGMQNALLMLPESGIIDPKIAIINPSNVIQYRDELTKFGIKPDF